jgi:hypothetical protein
MSMGKDGESDKAWEERGWTKLINKGLTSKMPCDNEKLYDLVF